MIGVLNKIIKINTVVIIGIYITNEGTSYYTLGIKKKKNKLLVVSANLYSNIEQLKKAFSIKTPVILLIDGKGVLNKKINLDNEADVAWKKNLDFDSIYYTELKAGENVFISFTRKKPIEEILEEFRKNDFQILDLYIGSIVASLLHPAINTDKLMAFDSVLEFEKEHLIDVSKTKANNEASYRVGNDEISGCHTSIYGAAIHHFVKHDEVRKSNLSFVNTDEIVYRKAFNIFGTIMLITFFMSLLASYFLIQYYSSKNIELNQENVFSNQTYQLIVKLEEQKEKKLRLLNDSGQMSKHFLSFYAYELSKSVPQTVTLDVVDIFPLKSEIKYNKKVEFTPKTITIKGNSASETVFNSWLEELNNMEWIQKFEILSVQKNKKNILQFQLKVLLNDF